MSVKNPNKFNLKVGQFRGSFIKALVQIDRIEKESVIMTPYWGSKDFEQLKEKRKPIIQIMMANEIMIYATSTKMADQFLTVDEFNAFSQIESQKAPYLLRVMRLLDLYENLNTSQIIEMTKLSPKSVCGSLGIMREKRLVNVNSPKDRMNNQKIYSLKRLRSLFYIIKLKRWKVDRKFPKKLKKLKKYEEKFENFPRDLEKIPINIPPKITRDLPEEIIPKGKIPLIKMNSALQEIIKRLYLRDFFCYECFKKGELIEVVNDFRFNVCPTCGVETEFYEEHTSFTKDNRLRKDTYNEEKTFKKNKNILS